MRNGKYVLSILAITVMTIIAISCSRSSSYPQQVAEALDAAGENRGELERVLEHYRQSGDSL